MVCSNQVNIQDEVNQVVIHELIHAYDDCRAANLDWANCAHHACSEVIHALLVPLLDYALLLTCVICVKCLKLGIYLIPNFCS